MNNVLRMISAILAMVVLPPLMGILAFVLWLFLPLPVDTAFPAFLAGAWTAIVVAALIRRGFE